MKNILFLVLTLVVIACSPVKVAYDYDKAVDFSKFKTYSYVDDNVLSDLNQLDRDRIIKAIETEMSLKGFSKSDTPEILLEVFIKTNRKVEATATTTGSGYGRYGRYGYGGGFSTTEVSYDEYTEGTLIINIIDKESEKIVWQGTGTKTLTENASPDKKESIIKYSVESILKNYPPAN